MPRFAWSARHADFPLPFPGSDAGPQAAATPVRSQPFPLDELRPTPWLRLGGVVLLLVAIAALAIWQFGGDDADDAGTAGVSGRPTDVAGAAQTRDLPTQRPGEGGAAVTSTPETSGAAAGATETAEGETPGAETIPTATPDPAAEYGIIQVESQEGETLIDVAERWGLEVSTLVWANPAIDDPAATLETGTLVTVPPVDGVIHEVAAGETLESIAALYGVHPLDIVYVAQNNVQSDEDLYPGLEITVPGATPAMRGGLAYYTVQEGDDLWIIAGYYGIDPLTIAYANDIPDDYLIYPGQELVIPPADGILYWTVAGDTVESIAAAFGVDPAVIRELPFNNVPGTAQPTPGQPILVPGITPVIDASKQGGGGGEPPATDPFAPTPGPEAGQASGSFMWPTTGNITQAFHQHHNGLDIANAAWTPIVAADGGVVTFAGWNNHGLGYAVAIDHGNGFVTWYGHLAEPPAVTSGQRISQGDWLGPMGATGKSTGPHLHFIIMLDGVYQDPLANLP